MVIQDVRNEADNKRFLKGVQQSQQGQWKKWEKTLQKSITWNDIWQMAPLRLSFLICSRYDQLSSKNNLFKWKKESDPLCPLCNDKPKTLEHVLNSCKATLGNGRYTWRHNRVLEELKKKKSTPNDEYENFVNAHLEAAAKYIPTKIKTKYRVPWETLAVREKRALVKTASKNYRKNPTNTNALKIKTAQYQLAGIYIKEQTEYIQNQIDKIRDSVEDRQSRIAWQTINEVSRRKNTAKAKLKAANQQERIKLWKQHFENLLGNPPKITHEPITRIISKQLDIKLGPFTQEELDSVLRKIKNRKAAGLDEIPPEIWKTRQFDDILLRHCNAVYNQNPIDRWMKGCILPFPKKGDLGLAKNYRGITLTSIAAKIYNALLRNRIEPKIDNILRKNQNGFRRNRSTTSQILTIRRILEGVRAKNLQATLIFVDFTKAFDSIHRGKMEQILLAYGIPKETVAAITILYRNTKVKVRSPDGDTEYFDIVAGVLQGDTLAPYLFIICLDYVLRTSIDKIKENGFELTKKRSRRYPATTITDADYADDIAILANTPDQAETLLHSLERAAASIGLYVNAHKTEYMCYNQTGDISTLEGTPLKLVDKFTYLGSSVESTEKDIETRLTKAWTAINRLSIIWKSDLTDKMKRSFFQAAVTSILLYGCTTWTLTKRLEKKLDGNYTRMLRAILNKSWQQHPTRHQLYGHLPPITKTIQVRRTRYAGHCWRSRDELIRDVLLWIPAQDDQLERTFSSYVRIQDVVLKTYLGRWTIGRSGERGSGISVLPARYDDDDDMKSESTILTLKNNI